MTRASNPAKRNGSADTAKADERILAAADGEAARIVDADGGDVTTAKAGDDGHRDGRPFETYPGGKAGAGTWQQIVGRFPRHSLYVEPFLGNGAVLRAKRPALRSIGVELNPMVLQRWMRLEVPGLELVLGCGIDWLCEHGPALPADALIYVDPPYPHETRTRTNQYGRCELSTADHVRLLDALAAVTCSVFISSYDNALYRERLAPGSAPGWEHASWQAMTRGGVRTEHLWYRIGGPGGIADPGVAGSNYRERERIKRKVQRWRAKFRELPDYEREAILGALLDESGRLPR